MAFGFSVRDTSFKFKVMGVMVLASVFSLLVAGGIFMLYDARTFKRDHILYLSSIGNIIGANVTSALLFDDKEVAGTMLSFLRSERSVKESGVFRNDGVLFLRYRRGDVPEDLPAPDIRAPGIYDMKDRLLLFLPVIWKGESLGTVYIYSDMTDLTDRLRRHSAITIVIINFSVIAAILLSLWLHRFISEPVLQLTRIARMVAEKQDFSVRVPASGRRDEFGVLVQAFNGMLEHIHEHDVAVNKARDELEIMVDERTKELREMSTTLRGILSNMSVITFRIDGNGVFTQSAGKGLERLGFKPGEMTGRSAYDVFPDMADNIKQAINGNMVFCETTGTRDGERWWFSTYLFPDADRPGYIAGFALDITKRKRAEEHERVLQDQLARDERMKSLGVLAGGVAHDLNNILGPMVILPKVIIDDLAAMPGADQEKIKVTLEDLKAIDSSARRAADVIKDLMTLGRRGSYQKRAFDLNQLVSKYMNTGDFKAMSGMRTDVEWVVELAEGLPPVLGSEAHLTRVLSNTVQNGFEAIPETSPGKIVLSTRLESMGKPLVGYETIPPGAYVVLSVRDNGEGIPDEYIERIFEPFFTRKKQTSRSGSGLGLAVVHGVVKDHNGFVNVASREGEGTVFELYFPVTNVAVEESGSDDIPAGKGERILVVDDESAQRQLSKRVLEKLGYSVAMAANGHEALDIFNSIKDGRMAPFDLLILDMIMESGFDGLTTLEHILAVNPAQKTIIASGYASTKRGAAAQKLGATWLSKPYSNDELARVVRKKLDRKTS